MDGRDHALQTVMALIIDDGVPSRGHRNNIFSTDFKFVGIDSKVQGQKILTAMDFHSGNLEESKPPSVPNTSQNNSKPKNETPVKPEIKKPVVVQPKPEIKTNNSQPTGGNVISQQ